MSDLTLYIGLGLGAFILGVLLRVILKFKKDVTQDAGAHTSALTARYSYAVLTLEQVALGVVGLLGVLFLGGNV